MRIYEGDHAYEIERILDPTTQLFTGWRYNVYRVRPIQQLLRSGETETQEEAELAGRNALTELLDADRKNTEGRPAA